MIRNSSSLFSTDRQTLNIYPPVSPLSERESVYGGLGNKNTTAATDTDKLCTGEINIRYGEVNIESVTFGLNLDVQNLINV